MGWLIALGILVLLSVVPLGICVLYDSDGPVIKIIAGPLHLQIIPSKKKTDKDKRNEKKAQKVKPAAPEKTSQKATANTKEKGGSFLDFMPLVQLALDFLGTSIRKLRISRLELNLVLAGDHPCDLAINYGKACATLGNLWPRLEEIFVIKKRDVQIQCDFEASQTLITAHADITITLGRLLYLIFSYGVRAVIQYVKITNKRKGGAAT